MNLDTVNPGVMAVAAHPDDAEFTSGGSLVRWNTEGQAVDLVVCTDGSKGSQNPEDDPKALSHLRRAEQEESAQVLGIRQVVWLGYPDGELDRVTDLVEKLAYQIRVLRPARLLAWDAWCPYQLHADHRTSGMASMDAVLAAGNPHFYPQQLTEGLKSHKVEEVYLYGSDQPDKWIDITNSFDVKMKAIECHQSQVDYLPDLAIKMSHCNINHGVEKGYTYAEAFKVIHPFCDT